MKKLYIILIFILAPINVCAAPAISDVTGTTLTGTGFGTKSTAAPIKWDTFESYTVDTHILNQGSSPQWTSTGGASGYPIADSTRSHGGSQAVYSDFTLNDNDCAFVFAEIAFTDTPEIYISHWIYYYNLTGVDADQPRADFFKLGRPSVDVAYSGAPVLKPSFWINYDIPETGKLVYQMLNDSTNASSYSLQDTAPSSHNFTYGSWHRMEFYVKLSTPGGTTNGEQWFRIDNVAPPLSVDSGDITLTRVTDETGEFNIYLMELSGCGYAADDHPFMWQDDMYIDNTRARVEIGNNAVFANRTHR